MQSNLGTVCGFYFQRSKICDRIKFEEINLEKQKRKQEGPLFYKEPLSPPSKGSPGCGPICQSCCALSPESWPLVLSTSGAPGSEGRNNFLSFSWFKDAEVCMFVYSFNKHLFKNI
jgi:hypothetical protein